MSVVVTTAVVLALALWAVSIYSRLVRARADVRRTWSAAEECVRRRHDAIAAVIEAARGPISTETLDAVSTGLRLSISARGPRDVLEKASALDVLVGRLQHAVNADEVLAGHERMRALQSELANLNAEVARERSSYDVAAASYNRLLEAFPANLVAGMAGFTRAERRRGPPKDGAQSAARR